MTRLCIVNGPWQLIMLFSALKDLQLDAKSEDRTILAYYHRSLSEPLITLMDEIRALAPMACSDRVLLNDLLSVSSLRRRWSWSGLLRALRMRIGAVAVDEIWMTSIADWPEGAVAEAFSDAKIIQYEDGLSSYFEGDSAQQERPPDNRIARLAVLARRFKNYLPCFNPFVIWTAARSAGRLRHRCSARHLYLANWLAPATSLSAGETHLVQTSSIRAMTSALSASLITHQDRAHMAGFPPGTVIFIAQNFSDGNQLDRETEMTVYRNAVRTLAEKGYSILWKEHPRALRPFCPELQREFGDVVKPYPIGSRIPLEITVEVMAEKPIFVGALSTSLFYLKHMYGCGVYQFAGDIMPHLAGSYARIAASVTGHFPSLSEIPPRA